MIRLVIDASAAAEYLLRTPLGRKLDDLVEDAFLIAPELLDAEVLAVLRRALLQESTARGWRSRISPAGRWTASHTGCS